MSILRSISLSQWVWGVLGAAFVGIGAVGLGIVDGGSSRDAAVRGQADEAPDFSLYTLDGTTFRLRDHRGTVVVLNFWATWCPPCRREIPDFVTLQKELGDQGVQFVGVALEREAGTKKVRAFADKMNVNYPVGLGTGTIAKKYGGVRGLPSTFLIGPDGTIRGHIPGMTTEERLRPRLEALLKEVP